MSTEIVRGGYKTPEIEVVKVEVEDGIAASIVGSAPDSDDSEFG